MAERTYGGHTLKKLRSLRKNPPDGAEFYMALREAARDLFAAAEDLEHLKVFINELVLTVERAADAAAKPNPGGGSDETLQVLQDTLSDPGLRKIINS